MEAHLISEVRRLGGVTYKNNPNWYKGIGDRTVCVLGYMCMVECKRPKGGRLSVAQKMWKKMLTDAGVPWHLICTHDEVDDFIRMVSNVGPRDRTGKILPRA